MPREQGAGRTRGQRCQRRLVACATTFQFLASLRAGLLAPLPGKVFPFAAALIDEGEQLSPRQKKGGRQKENEMERKSSFVRGGPVGASPGARRQFLQADARVGQKTGVNSQNSGHVSTFCVERMTPPACSANEESIRGHTLDSSII